MGSDDTPGELKYDETNATVGKKKRGGGNSRDAGSTLNANAEDFKFVQADQT